MWMNATTRAAQLIFLPVFVVIHNYYCFTNEDENCLEYLLNDVNCCFCSASVLISTTKYHFIGGDVHIHFANKQGHWFSHFNAVRNATSPSCPSLDCKISVVQGLRILPSNPWSAREWSCRRRTKPQTSTWCSTSTYLREKILIEPKAFFERRTRRP